MLDNIQTEGEDSLLQKLRQKRKWQIALRRYVLEKNVSEAYAPYFGLEIEGFRNWIELQFTGSMTWQNFAKSWQFEHIVPVGYFDFSKDEDLKLCWNFTNIRVEALHSDKSVSKGMVVMAAKAYYERLHHRTGYEICNKMLQKIAETEELVLPHKRMAEKFITDRLAHLETLAALTCTELSSLNRGKKLSDILLEREMLKKFG